VLESHVRSRRERGALDALLDEFGITIWPRQRAGAVGGERRRTEIARSVAATVFMLLDEPFAGVDPIAVSEVKALVRQLTRRGIGC